MPSALWAAFFIRSHVLSALGAELESDMSKLKLFSLVFASLILLAGIFVGGVYVVWEYKADKLWKEVWAYSLDYAKKNNMTEAEVRPYADWLFEEEMKTRGMGL